jgi:hypothetical protein
METHSSSENSEASRLMEEPEFRALRRVARRLSDDQKNRMIEDLLSEQLMDSLRTSLVAHDTLRMEEDNNDNQSEADFLFGITPEDNFEER